MNVTAAKLQQLASRLPAGVRAKAEAVIHGLAEHELTRLLDEVRLAAQAAQTMADRAKAVETMLGRVAQTVGVELSVFERTALRVLLVPLLSRNL